MKKILIIPSWYPTPDTKVGYFFQEQAQILQDKYDVRILFVVQQNLSRRKNLLKFIYQKIFKSIQYIKIDCGNEYLYKNPPLFYYKSPNYLKKRGYEILLKVHSNILQEFIADNWKPDVIHAHTVNPAGIIANWLSGNFNIPYIITEHNFFSLPAYETSVRNLVKKSLEQASQVLTVSYDKSRQILSYGIKIKPRVVWNLVDENKFLLQPAYKPNEKLQILTITAASFFKDNLTLLLTLKWLKDQGINFEATIIGLMTWGKEEERKMVSDFIAEHELRTFVNLIDYAERDQIPVWVKNMHVFLLTSIAEGLPVSVLEAMAGGLYVVATKHGGTEDIINSKEIGSIVNLQDYQSAGKAIKAIANGELVYDPSRIRDRVVGLCGLAAFKNRLSDIYDNAIQSKSR
ncbi:MAG TPA: glycosyltransferase [Hanamia sp.]